MTAAILVMLVSVANTPFIADATAEREFIVHRPESIVRSRIEDIQMLWRNMPGVVAITAYDADRWLYQTEREMPFSDPVKTDFVLVRTSNPGVTFHTPELAASNWMSIRLVTKPMADNRTLVSVRTRVRLVRDEGGSIHVFAPLLGESFISDRMEEDLSRMLEIFESNVRRELESMTEITTSADLEP
ncbi:MAG: hypothetical protein IT282_01840 [Bacteroidetes bacterium]|nr:hypothetical protein [Bacteroidota bacterium]